MTTVRAVINVFTRCNTALKASADIVFKICKSLIFHELYCLIFRNILILFMMLSIILYFL